MKISIPVSILTLGLALPLWAQSPSPAASPGSAAAAGSPASGASSRNTDLYHVHFAKSAVGKAAEHGDFLKKPDPDAPMPGHFIVLRHQNGDSWDYCVISHLGTKATLDAARPAPPAAVPALNEWHTDTYAAGPAWTQFAKEMGVDDAAKSATSAYVVSIYRPAPGQREALDKFMNEPPDRASDSTSGNVVLQHMEGAAWTFLKVSRNNSWADFGKDMAAGIAGMNKSDAGWFKLRNMAGFHTDTLCDRLAP